MSAASTYREPTIFEILAEAEELFICSGFKLTRDQAADRVCESHGWVSWDHMTRCKTTRNVQ